MCWVQTINTYIAFLEQNTSLRSSWVLSMVLFFQFCEVGGWCSSTRGFSQIWLKVRAKTRFFFKLCLTSGNIQQPMLSLTTASSTFCFLEVWGLFSTKKILCPVHRAPDFVLEPNPGNYEMFRDKIIFLFSLVQNFNYCSFSVE